MSKTSCKNNTINKLTVVIESKQKKDQLIKFITSYKRRCLKIIKETDFIKWARSIKLEPITKIKSFLILIKRNSWLKDARIVWIILDNKVLKISDTIEEIFQQSRFNLNRQLISLTNINKVNSQGLRMLNNKNILSYKCNKLLLSLIRDTKSILTLIWIMEIIWRDKLIENRKKNNSKNKSNWTKIKLGLIDRINHTIKI